MAKQLEIQLKFTTGGSAEKLLEKLDLLATAQRSLSRNQRQFNNANLKAVKAFKQLTQAEEKHRFAMLKVSTQVAKLKEQLRVLKLRNKSLEVQLKKNIRVNNRFRISTAGLQRVIGSIRNKILLVTFAFGGMAAGIRSAVQTSMQFEAVQVRLNSMFGSVRAGERAFQKFNQVAATTPFTLTDVVEAGAALKAFGTNAEEMIKPTADLAAFMGTTATEAAAALGRAFAGGAGAADILRERGILQLIRDTKGIEDLSKLTLPEFRKALQETLIDPEVGIAGATDKLAQTMAGAVSNMADAFTRMKAAIGDFVMMKGLIGELAESFENVGEFFMQLSETPLDTTIRHLKEMNVDTSKLELSQAKYLKLKMEEEGNAIRLAEFKELDEKRENNRKKLLTQLADIQAKIKDTKQREKEITEELGAFTFSQIIAGQEAREKELLDAKKISDENEKNSEILRKGANEYEAVLLKIAGLEEKILDTRVKGIDLGFAFSFNPDALIAAYSKFRELNEAEQKIMDESEILRLQTREQLFTDHFNKVLTIAQQNIEAQKQAELSALRDTDAYRNASAEKRQDMERDALKQLQKQQNTIFKINQANEIIKVILSSMSTASKLKDMQKELEGVAASMYAVGNVVAGNKATAGALALKAQRGLVIASGAAQAGLIAGQKPPAFARGGSFITQGQQMIMVGDNSGGRERVDITPLSSPDFGDAGGGGSINVNIMGNVIGTQEFVRDSLLPEIENSIRRNLA